MGTIWKKSRDTAKSNRLLKQFNDGMEGPWRVDELEEDLQRELLYECRLIEYLEQHGKDFDGIIERRLKIMHGRSVIDAAGCSGL